MSKNDTIGYYEIVDNEVQKVNEAHPYLSMNNKNIFIEKFVNDLDLKEVSIDSNRVLSFKYKNLDYKAYIEHVDGGGKDTIHLPENTYLNARKKICIPFAVNSFKDLIKEFEKVLVINLYFPLVKKDNKLIVDEDNYFYFIVKPNDVYESKVIRNYLISRDKNNDEWKTSNRWSPPLQQILKIKTSKNLFEFNKKKNVYVITNKNIKSFFDEGIINKDYLNMLNFLNEEILKRITVSFKATKIIDEILISKHRQIFRNKLYESRPDHKCDIEDCDINLKECLIASHIKAVNEILADESIDDKQKLFQIEDANNGLLLCRNHDCLFDKHLISFDSNNGNLFAGNYIKEYLDLFQLKENVKTINILDEKIKKYMTFHNEIFEKKN